MWGTTCPWCGRAVRGRNDGKLREHKSNRRIFLSDRRAHCRGSGADPKSLTEERRAELRREWYDDEGWPVKLHGLG